jgi:signal transduction histidine kinase
MGALASDESRAKKCVHSVLTWFIQTGVTAVIYMLGADLGLLLTIPGTNIGFIWPPVGISIGMMLLFGYRVWPALVIGNIINLLPGLLHKYPLFPGLLIFSGQTAADLLQSLLAVFLFRMTGTGKNIADRPLDVLRLVGILVLSQMAGAVLGVFSILVPVWTDWGKYIFSWSIYWIANVVSALVIVPVIVLWRIPKRIQVTRRFIYELLYYFFVIVFTFFLFSFKSKNNNYFEDFTIFLGILPLFFFGYRGGVISVLAVSSVAIGCTFKGFGPFTGLSPGDSSIFIEIYLGAQALTTLVVASVLAQRKQAEDKLTESEHWLREQVQQELAKNREKDLMLIQQSRLATLGEMIGNIAHQWRQPLNAVSLIIQNLIYAYDHDVMNREYLEGIVDRSLQIVDHMSHTIDDFRNYFKPDREKTRFFFRDIFIRTYSLLEAGFKNSGISLDSDIDEGCTIFGYPNEFGQVMLNLLNNAREALIARRVKNPRIMVTAKVREGKCEIFVRDNAGGISEENIDRVFDPYFTTKENGTGIGLYMSRMIVERNMGGKLSVRNHPEGAEFRILI